MEESLWISEYEQLKTVESVRTLMADASSADSSQVRIRCVVARRAGGRAEALADDQRCRQFLLVALNANAARKPRDCDRAVGNPL